MTRALGAVPTRVGTANIRADLSRADAVQALEVVTAGEPDLVALQEWSPLRRGSPGTAVTGYSWVSPLVGGCAVGARSDRFSVLSTYTRWLSRPGWAPRSDRRIPLEPGRAATILETRDERTGRDTTVVSFHLVSGAQEHGVYRGDRPRLVDRHRREVAQLERLVHGLAARLSSSHGALYVAGDSNYHGLRLPGLVSVWDHCAGTTGGTLGPRRVDDVFSVTRPSASRLLETGSDHRAVLVDYGIEG